MDNRVYWIWMQSAFGPGSAKPRQAVDRAGSAEAFYKAGVRYWSNCGFISDLELSALSGYGLEQAAAALEYCERVGHSVLTPDMPEYPALLKQIYNPPAVLYLRGTLPEEGVLPIGIVGTRKASRAGLDAASGIAHELAAGGAAVISGGALGVDSAAHRGAILGGGRTVAVLPCGLDYPYLMDNAMLRREILDSGGALLSEFPMQTPVHQGAFQIRNRIISGMSGGILVAEAPKKSGAMITAKYAAEQDREIFVYIGPDEKAFAGCISLAEDGATAVTAAAEILRAFSDRRRTENRLLLSAALSNLQKRRASAIPKELQRDAATPAHDPAREIRTAAPRRAQPPEDAPAVLRETEAKTVAAAPKTEKPEPRVPAGLSADAGAVFRALTGEPKHVSALEAETGLAAGRVLAALTELELFGCANALPGQRFTKL